jgi:hypothetical protein
MSSHPPMERPKASSECGSRLCHIATTLAHGPQTPRMMYARDVPDKQNQGTCGRCAHNVWIV